MTLMTTITFFTLMRSSVNGKIMDQSSKNDELHNTPNTRSLFLQGPILLKIKQLESIIASLAKQLIGIQASKKNLFFP